MRFNEFQLAEKDDDDNVDMKEGEDERLVFVFAMQFTLPTQRRL